MPSTLTRRRLLETVGAVIGAGAAGCLTGADAPEAADRDDPSDVSTTETGDGESTVSPELVSDERAKERALAAEDDYLQARLSDATCLDDWGTGGGVATPAATVRERTSTGVRVAVEQPFWWTKTRTRSESDTSVQVHADAVSEAEYLVTAETTERQSGDGVSPC